MTIENRTTDRSISRAVKRVLKAQSTQDGAGVSPYRAISQSAQRELDSLLLLNEMYSDRPDDHKSPALVRERTVAVFDEGDHVSAITDNSTARFLLIAGRPIKESIVRQGPFVMNTQAKINRAILDYKVGTLG